MKMRIYPSTVQAEKIEKIFRALHIAYNITFHEVFQQNPQVCTLPKEDGSIWPDYHKMAGAAWKKELIRRNPAVAEAPAAAITTNNGLFLSDAKKAWKEGMHNLPVNKANRKDFHFYNGAHPRCSYMVQLEANKIEPSSDNDKVAWVTLPLIEGKIKARGFNRKISFGSDGRYTYEEAVANGDIASKLTTRISKDACGAYFISVIFNGEKRSLYRTKKAASHSEKLGLDVGVKDIAALSNGYKVENKHFKREKEKRLEKMHRQLSRRWGPANSAFRDYNRNAREENRDLLAKPSKGYIKIQRNHALLERKIARQRETYYQCKTAKIVDDASMIAVETLYVKNMMQNHRLAYALGDAAMAEFIRMLKYKAERSHVPLKAIGVFEPSSQMCSCCDAINTEVKNMSIRDWICPVCGAKHDRDINAARSILKIALTKENCKDKEVKEVKSPAKTGRSRPKENIIFEDRPNVVIIFSKNLTRLNDPRYIIMNKETGETIDDAQGAGYRSITKARNCYRAKCKWNKQNQQ